MTHLLHCRISLHLCDQRFLFGRTHFGDQQQNSMFNLWARRSVFVCALTLWCRRSFVKMLGVLLRHSLRKCPIFPHLKRALHSFEAWLSRLQCLQGPLELFLLSFGWLEFVFWRLGPSQLLSRLLAFCPPFEFFWNRTVRFPRESVLFEREGWLRFGVLFRCREASWLGLGLAFLNPSVSFRTSSSIHSLAGGSGVSREIAFTLVSAILLLMGLLSLFPGKNSIPWQGLEHHQL